MTILGNGVVMGQQCQHNCGCLASDLLDQMPKEKAELEAFMNALPLTEFPERNRGFLIESLHKAQGLFGYLPEAVQAFVAKKLGLHLSEVYGVISFYSYFTDVPQGKFKINVCMGTACFVKGADKVLEEFKRYLHVEVGQTTADQRYFLGSLRCVGACSLAPVVMANDRVYGNVTTKMIPDIIAECK